MQEPDVRLELVKAMIPVASRHGLTSGEIVDLHTVGKICARIVVSWGSTDPDASENADPARQGQPGSKFSEPMTPPRVDKSNQAFGHLFHLFT